MTDIDDQKRTEGELRELRESLEERVEERTTRLEATLRELDAFTYTVAHDLRAPLRSMVGYSQVLLEEEAPRLGRPSKDHLARIGDAARRMDQLIRDLLEYSRLGRADQGLEAVQVPDIAGEVLRQMEGDLEKRGADVRMEEPMEAVRGHRLSLALALGNLISNAVKFVPPDRAPRVRIRTRRRGDWVRVEVEDNGLGVPVEYRERIFGVFERLGRDEKYPGTGIGLAIARRSVERMGGRTGVEPAPGGGSRFWIDLRPAA
jgi:signal transduction histidine kinase